MVRDRVRRQGPVPNPGLAFLTYDDEHHRFAFANMSLFQPDGAETERQGAIGVDHVAYTYASLGDLLENYAQLREKGSSLLVHPPRHHGVVYYADPDGNQMEFQVESFGSSEEATAFMKEHFEANPLGVEFDPYEITAPLGAGGMGEVFRARDTKLDREVAIKVLPAEVARDEERLARFRREAHLLAALNHPNIAAIHGLDEADGKPFLVLELVPGEDLAQRLKRGPIPLDEALPIARQIAEALEEAHEKGIVHRDLKPANVKVTPDGKVKVLDFGLAKAWSGDAGPGSSPDLSQSPTLAHTGTAAGLILGTAAYMSPEQARGKAVDRRADIWAFGVVLFEMLTGKALFAGETVTDVLAAVVTREPDLDALPAATPPAVRQLLQRCLDKDPRRRLRDIGEARVLLEAPDAEAAAPSARRRVASPLGGRGARPRLSWRRAPSAASSPAAGPRTARRPTCASRP